MRSLSLAHHKVPIILLSRFCKVPLRSLWPLKILICSSYPFFGQIRQLLNHHSIILLIARSLPRRRLQAILSLIILICKTPGSYLSLCHEYRGWPVHASPGPIRPRPAVLPLPLNLMHELLVGLFTNLHAEGRHCLGLVVVTVKTYLEDTTKSLLALEI